MRRIETAICNYQGGRKHNEDNVRCLTLDNICAIVVADGLGGHGGGQIASSIAADYITKSFMKEPLMDPACIRCLFEQANMAVVKAQTPIQKMKSTGAALFINDGAAIWGHTGDSRLYHFKDGVLAEQTLDHSVSQMAVFSGEITKEQIRHHVDRNKVLKAFGDAGGFKADISSIYMLESGYHAFLLCTDGFWEYVLELEMEIELIKSYTPLDWIRAMNQRLAQRVPENHDNFSAAAVLINIESKDGRLKKCISTY